MDAIGLGAPAMLAMLALIPAVGLCWWWLWRARRLHHAAVRAAIAGDRRGLTLSGWLIVLALALLAIAAARPMWNAGEQTFSQSRAALVVTLDVSESMAAEDVPDAAAAGSARERTVSRFAAAKAEVHRLIDARRGGRVGLVIFAGEAYLRFPLTRDHEAALQVLEALQPGEALVPPGSNLAAAIDLAASALRDSGDETAHGTIVIVSDGETHFGNASAAAATARAAGAQVFTFGVGSSRGATIPQENSSDPKLDVRTNRPIVTRLDAEQLRRVAEAGGGRYRELDAPGRMAAMSADLAALDLVRPVIVEETALAEQFQWFAIAAMISLAASTAARAFGLRLTRRIALLGLIVGSAATAGSCAGDSVEQLNRDGIAHYEAAEYGEALASWRDAQRLQRLGHSADGAAQSRLQLNLGRALHQLGAYDRAETETLAALRSNEARVRAQAWFQAGNHRWANDDLLGARLAYIEALRAWPSLFDAKVNLELVNGILRSLDEQTAAAESSQGEEGATAGSSGQSSGEAGDSGSTPTEADASAPDAPATAAGAEPGATEASGLGEDGSPSAPSFADEQSDLDRRDGALEALDAALEALPLEQASLEQALAVLDALRAVPGERLAAGRLRLPDRPLDW